MGRFWLAPLVWRSLTVVVMIKLVDEAQPRWRESAAYAMLGNSNSSDQQGHWRAVGKLRPCPAEGRAAQGGDAMATGRWSSWLDLLRAVSRRSRLRRCGPSVGSARSGRPTSRSCHRGLPCRGSSCQAVLALTFGQSFLGVDDEGSVPGGPRNCKGWSNCGIPRAESCRSPGDLRTQP